LDIGKFLHVDNLPGQRRTAHRKISFFDGFPGWRFARHRPASFVLGFAVPANLTILVVRFYG
jgi:hypothetical protein